jgi:hypothetical protein
VAPGDAWRALAGMTRTMALAGTSVEVPVAPALALIVASHAAQHGAAHPKVVTDLERAVERAPAETWIAAARLAERLDAGPTLAIGLRTVPAGEAVAAQLGLPAEPLVRAATEPGSRARLAVGVERLHRTYGTRARARLLLREALPPREFMPWWSPLARGGGRPGLAAAYGWRWLWLIAHTGPSVRAWRRSRR